MPPHSSWFDTGAVFYQGTHSLLKREKEDKFKPCFNGRNSQLYQARKSILFDADNLTERTTDPPFRCQLILDQLLRSFHYKIERILRY